MIQTHIASISISKTEQKACCTLYPHIKKELDTVSPGKLLFRFLNPEKPDVPLNKNDAFQKVQKRHVQEKR